MLKIIETENLEKIYNYQIKFNAPFFISKDFALWRKSFEEDVDGEGRVLFKEIFVKVAWEENEIVGFIQYGKTAFGFDNQGEILKHWLYDKGVTRFDTDTAISNTIAQHYYDKNGFIREGITRSYYWESKVAML